MKYPLLETIDKNKITLVLSDTNVGKELQNQLHSYTHLVVIYRSIPETKTIEDLQPDRKYLLILDNFAEDNHYENIWQRYGLERFDAKVIIICRPSLLKGYQDPSLYFVPIINNKFQKKLFGIYKISSVQKSKIIEKSKLFESKKIKPEPLQVKHKSLRDHFFNQKLMTQDAVMMQMLADRVKQSEFYKNLLFRLIYASRDDAAIQVAAANAITVLNYAKLSFSGMDLSRIKISNADLTGAILYRTNLSEADITGVNLRKSILQETNNVPSALKSISAMRSRL